MTDPITARALDQRPWQHGPAALVGGTCDDAPDDIHLWWHPEPEDEIRACRWCGTPHEVDERTAEVGQLQGRIEQLATQRDELLAAEATASHGRTDPWQAVADALNALAEVHPVHITPEGTVEDPLEGAPAVEHDHDTGRWVVRREDDL